MIDKTIPYCNVIMTWRSQNYITDICLPVGYRFCTYEDGFEFRWAEMEVANNDFDTYDNAVRYFYERYMKNMDKLRSRFIGIKDLNGYLCGSVICWNDEKNLYTGGEEVPTVHWLIVDPEEQHKGIGEALVRKLVLFFDEMGEKVIFLHTQPWSYEAIWIYYKCGFRINCRETFRDYVNEGDKGMKILGKYMPNDKYSKLIGEVIK